MATNFLTAHQIELFATNTGELYQKHLEMARRNASPWDWIAHVETTVMDLYRRQIGKAEARLHEVNAAADALRAYYAQHITEF